MIVIGNGESRKNIDISILEGPTVGCNAIHRDYSVDYLVCVDYHMLAEAINRKVNKTTLVYTRQHLLYRYNQEKFIRPVPDLPYQGMNRWDDPIHWGSGPYAVLIGAIYTKLKEVKLIGFDLYSKDTKINNVYKDTFGYKENNSHAVDPRYWIHQIGKVFECFPNIQFTIYQDDNWELPQAWKYPNVKVDNISNIYYNT